MRRDTRANLLFLTLFLAISLPGLVVLFKKKLDPNAPPMYLPDPVKTRLPYMAPFDVPSAVTRVIPEETGRWVASLTAARAGQTDVLLHGHDPVMSENRAVQLAAIKEEADRTTLSLLAWSPDYPADAGRYRVSAECDSKTIPGKVVRADAIDVPAPVRHELIYAGYAKPPATVVWLTVTLGAPTAGMRPLTVVLSRGDRPNDTIHVRLEPSG